MIKEGYVTISATLFPEPKYPILSICCKDEDKYEEHENIIQQMREYNHLVFWVHTFTSPTKKTTMKFTGLPTRAASGVKKLPRQQTSTDRVINSRPPRSSPKLYIEQTCAWSMTSPQYMFKEIAEAIRNRNKPYHQGTPFKSAL